MAKMWLWHPEHKLLPNKVLCQLHIFTVTYIILQYTFRAQLNATQPPLHALSAPANQRALLHETKRAETLRSFPPREPQWLISGPSLFGSFRKPGRETAERLRLTPARWAAERRAECMEQCSAGMGLFSRALCAARSCRAIALPACNYQAVSGRGSAAAIRPQQPRRGLSARPRLDELFAIPSLSRLLEARVQGEAGTELAARIQRLRDKERELRDTRELALQGEAHRKACARSRLRPPRRGGEGRAEQRSAWAGRAGVHEALWAVRGVICITRRDWVASRRGRVQANEWHCRPVRISAAHAWDACRSAGARSGLHSSAKSSRCFGWRRCQTLFERKMFFLFSLQFILFRRGVKKREILQLEKLLVGPKLLVSVMWK